MVTLIALRPFAKHLEYIESVDDENLSHSRQSCDLCIGLSERYEFLECEALFVGVLSLGAIKMVQGGFHQVIPFGFLPRLQMIAKGLLPYLAQLEMTRQHFHLLVQLIAMQALNCICYLAVQDSAPFE